MNLTSFTVSYHMRACVCVCVNGRWQAALSMSGDMQDWQGARINPGWGYRGRHKAGTQMERRLVCRKVPDSGLPNQKDSFQVSPESDPLRGTFRWGSEGGFRNQRSQEYLDTCP